MTQHVLQTENDTKRLIKSYTVSEKCPIEDIEEVHDLNRSQIVIEDTDLYKKCIETYKKYKLDAKFTLNEDDNTVTCDKWEE